MFSSPAPYPVWPSEPSPVAKSSAQQAPPIFPPRPSVFSSLSPYPEWPSQPSPAAQSSAFGSHGPECDDGMDWASFSNQTDALMYCQTLRCVSFLAFLFSLHLLCVFAVCRMGLASPGSVHFPNVLLGFFLRRGDEKKKQKKEEKVFLQSQDFWLLFCCFLFFDFWSVSQHSFLPTCMGLHCSFFMCARLPLSGLFEGPDSDAYVLFWFCCFKLLHGCSLVLAALMAERSTLIFVHVSDYGGRTCFLGVAVYLATVYAFTVCGGVHLSGHFCFSAVKDCSVFGSGEKAASRMDWFLEK